MALAISLGRRNLGQTSPNPSVGCVLVKNDVIVGRGYTAPGGRPHAETQALKQAGSVANGSTAYITLEPCSHEGKTPPCAQALVEAGVKRAVIATIDLDKRVNGKGISILFGDKVLGKLFKQSHVNIIPCLGAKNDPEQAEVILSDEINKLEIQRGLEAELEEVVNSSDEELEPK